eukprot:TRINITY_DN9756_c0_g2_i2.p3 TRINITY_DN9756_c0_g2~~TRINITY_DN9756_c0_g2_i2.p3  ORF type:complete len:119 (-),score=8.68 TRINITY_DN9756_c0_g2_i2:176-532(-)
MDHYRQAREGLAACVCVRHLVRAYTVPVHSSEVADDDFAINDVCPVSINDSECHDASVNFGMWLANVSIELARQGDNEPQILSHSYSNGVKTKSIWVCVDVVGCLKDTFCSKTTSCIR